MRNLVDYNPATGGVQSDIYINEKFLKAIPSCMVTIDEKGNVFYFDNLTLVILLSKSDYSQVDHIEYETTRRSYLIESDGFRTPTYNELKDINSSEKTYSKCEETLIYDFYKDNVKTETLTHVFTYNNIEGKTDIYINNKLVISDYFAHGFFDEYGNVIYMNYERDFLIATKSSNYEMSYHIKSIDVSNLSDNYIQNNMFVKLPNHSETDSHRLIAEAIGETYGATDDELIPEEFLNPENIFAYEKVQIFEHRSDDGQVIAYYPAEQVQRMLDGSGYALLETINGVQRASGVVLTGVLVTKAVYFIGGLLVTVLAKDAIMDSANKVITATDAAFKSIAQSFKLKVANKKIAEAIRQDLSSTQKYPELDNKNKKEHILQDGSSPRGHDHKWPNLIPDPWGNWDKIVQIIIATILNGQHQEYEPGLFSAIYNVTTEFGTGIVEVRYVIINGIKTISTALVK